MVLFCLHVDIYTRYVPGALLGRKIVSYLLELELKRFESHHVTAEN